MYKKSIIVLLLAGLFLLFLCLWIEYKRFNPDDEIFTEKDYYHQREGLLK